ncbi:MAG: hypothetical protein GW779_05630 [Candidatus Altiarchaeum hamiconexum]|uniref:(5-formylfuran-3-yl)methyl phosphate synthase n=1 Tax=Candidatus Altarchaeum hamiconexum TaxID=1803513 RepID=A0A8J8CG51_9ARCH|nr:hypothetical protein [Candidatus Altarchaeum hamiconexum]OIQ04418.1 MAG: hypothetical protein AUK59_07520 [Candidatus Altarchaeum sp. CG2_30_32_3053]PIN68066.1 MAG: hypothetical protein COV98_00595 [Candidatus Altarchaeum sp. CG12_big_fil_rev_8_21_14_0_65_33_22]PIV28013.1 MAG: hypothetical protein COS36_03685 [Candidatus Altarchaeum sp. CG03_land_8_20_14_0_80_32_618]PIZ31093.1 MAG: hypothetical protein COY41_03045 [Candidatus Altarchaeum sp. CG_4_10_14_0_8_um_filter_32_851]PJC14459.1 MAG: h
MKLLVSVRNVLEAINAIEGKADIIDVKNPKEGSLGACTPKTIKETGKISHNYNLLCSAAIGDVQHVGNASLAALGAAICCVDYIKVGLMTESTAPAVSIMKAVTKEVSSYKNFYGEKIKVVAVGFADWYLANTFPVEELYNIGLAGNCDVLMIDTAIKGGKNLFDFMKKKEVADFARTASDLGFEVAIAGSLRNKEISVLRNISEIDIIGVRSAACGNFDRNGEIDKNRVKELKENLEQGTKEITNL